MASKGKERENFYRICILVVKHIKNALVEMFKYYLREYKEDMSFEEFIHEHIGDIGYLTRSKILYKEEVNKLIVNGITADDLEVTLVRCLLDNLCPDLFMDDDCQTLQDFLKKNQHNIYHLFKCDERCCQCNDHYTVPVREQLLKENEYKNMFESSTGTNCTAAICSCFTCKNTEYIKLDYRTRCTVFEHFSRIFEAVQNLKKLRDKAYGHIEADEIPDDDYDGYYKEIEANIMVLAKHCGKEKDTRQALDDVQTRSLDETLCIQYKISLSEDIKRDIEMMEEIGKIRQILQENSQILQENSNIQQENSQILQKNSQMLQEIPPHLQKITEEIKNFTVTKTNLTKDDQAGAMASSSQESSSNNISTGNDQSSQDIHDGVVLHAEEDREAAMAFITNMVTKNPDLDIDLTIYETLTPGKSYLESAVKLFDSCRFLFVFVTQKFNTAYLEKFIAEVATIETLRVEEKNERLIPVLTEKTFHVSTLSPIQPLKYYNYLAARELQGSPDQYVIKCFTNLIKTGRTKYLVN